ncbi:hypothetical protein M407DRAFT_24868 [Tulasnella calospora MUT 4182]|uniref:EamA domain-containing protein n=1 Tax=Tulasnella calospora MUT 4182 TaxID=1051891 RepID=A0A0C3KWI8_9AGAM|nr:hypothetical protein M407DRAFT_24868 [Tulasnella calospora MUT 4182]
MTDLLPSSSQPMTTRDGLLSADGARATVLFILVLGAGVSMTLVTDYVEGDLGYRQPYFIVYATHSFMSLLIPLHLAYLSWKTKLPVSRYIVELKHTLAQQFPKPDSPGINYRSLTRTSFISATWFTAGALLWYLSVIFAPISDANAIWSSNAFWTYIMSVLASSYCTNLSERQVHKWESRKLLAVSMSSVGVAVIVYGGNSQTQQPTSPSKSSNGSTSSATSQLVLLGDVLALLSSLSTASWAVWYDRSVALSEGEGSQPPSPQPSDNIDGAYAEYQPLLTDDGLTQMTGETEPTSTPPSSLPFGLHANFFSWTIGMITFFIFWIPLFLINIMKLGPPVKLPPNPQVWLCVGLISVMTMIYTAGSMENFSCLASFLWVKVLEQTTERPLHSTPAHISRPRYYRLTMTNSLPSSSQPVTTRDGLLSADRARAAFLFTLLLGASVGMTLMTDYVEGDLGYRQPYFIVYAAHSCMSLLIPLHLAYLSWKTKLPVSRYIAELKHTLAQQFPKPGSPGMNYNSLTRTLFVSATWYTGAALLWYLSVIFAPISDVTAIWSSNAFWTYIISVLASSYCISSSGRHVHKWESRKLLAVSMASVGVAAVVYGGNSQTQQPTSPSKFSNGLTSSSELVLLGDALALVSALSTASWAVWYDRSIALPEGSGSRPPSPQCSDHIDGAHAEYRPLRTDDELTRLTGATEPTSTPPSSLPFGLHANFFSWTTGMITFFVLWIPLFLINIMKLGPPVELPPNPKVWLCVGFICVMSMTYNAGALILLYMWGPVLIAVASLLTIVLVLAGDALFGKGMQTITFETLLGSTMIVGAFGLLARDSMKKA